MICFVSSGAAEPAPVSNRSRLVSLPPKPSRHPELSCKLIRNGTSETIVGAISGRPVSFADLEWKATVGNKYGAAIRADTYNLDLNADMEKASAEACFQAMSDVISVLEEQFGAFGQHPAFTHDDKTGMSLYGGLGAFEVRSAGRQSIVRDYGESQYTSFAETDEGGGKAVMVGAIYLDDYKSCGLRVHAFQSEERIERASISRKKFE